MKENPMNKIETGKKDPAFTLQDENGDQGRALVFCGHKLDATVLGCSRDTPESHRKFIAKYKLLSDPDHEVMEKYGAWGEKNNHGKKTMGVIGSTALIDPSGKTAHHFATVKAAGHAEPVRTKLAELARIPKSCVGDRL
jgi:peroxiredoxin